MVRLEFKGEKKNLSGFCISEWFRRDHLKVTGPEKRERRSPREDEPIANVTYLAPCGCAPCGHEGHR